MVLYWLGAILFLILGMPSLLVKRRAEQLDYKLETIGMTGEARVVRLWTDWDENYSVWLEYDVTNEEGTTTYKRHLRVNKKTYYSLGVGASIPIRYLPDKPKTLQLTGAYRDNYTVSSAVYLGFICWGGAAVLAVLALTTPSGYSSLPTTAETNTASSGSSVDFSVIQEMIEPKIGVWKTSTKDQAMHHIDPAQIGMRLLGVREIIYGYCPDQTFYTLVSTDGNAYAYSSRPDDFCWSDSVAVTELSSLDGGWEQVRFAEVNATPTT